MNKIISKLEDLDGLQYYNIRIETLKTNQKVNIIIDGVIRQVYNLKTDSITPYQKYTLEEIILDVKNIYNFNIVYQKPISLSPKELELLKALKVLGFNWIIRDKTGECLGAYKIKPKKCESYYSVWFDVGTVLNQDLFQFITFETGAYEIPNLD